MPTIFRGMKIFELFPV